MRDGTAARPVRASARASRTADGPELTDEQTEYRARLGKGCDPVAGSRLIAERIALGK
jgi:hypothetical protein